MSFHVAIDGPAGAGKSTIAKEVARQMQFLYLDTGAMYRAIGLYLIRSGISPSDQEQIAAHCAEADVQIRYENGEQQVLLNGEQVNAFLREEEVGRMASAAAANPAVRGQLLSLQRRIAEEHDVVMDGRDIGTCVLPDAELKIYLTASSAERARRRCLQLAEQGEAFDPAKIEEDIIRRDAQDMNRAVAPLRQAEDAVRIDSSAMTEQQVTDQILSLIRGRMRVHVAKTAGFCFGVERAVKTVEEALSSGSPVITLGPIIHNEGVVEEFTRRGVRIISSPEELTPEDAGAQVVIRSHGVGKDIYRQLDEKQVKIIDATCPFVAKIHERAEKAWQDGEGLIIIGSAHHPEVEGIRGWYGGEAVVIGTEEEARSFAGKKDQCYCVVCQTTFNFENYKKLVEIIKQLGYYITAMESICNATYERQTEAARLSKTLEAMIVIGGRESSNTQKLFEICRKNCMETFYIQSPADLDPLRMRSFRSIGITAGASTPKTIIKEVFKHVGDEL